MSKRQTPSGTRQRIWTALLSATERCDRNKIAVKANASRTTTSTYLSMLKTYGYVSANDEGWQIIKKTGPLAPLISGSGKCRDLNLDPPMRGDELDSAIADTGLSLNAFAERFGLGPGMSTRLRQMINGQRPVSETAENAVKASKSTS